MPPSEAPHHPAAARQARGTSGGRWQHSHKVAVQEPHRRADHHIFISNPNQCIRAPDSQRLSVS
eukprot:1431495-Prymnesium_polylepis.2